MNETKRNLRERKFIEAYITNGGNATRAYLAINPNCKEKSARELGHRMLTKVDIKIEKILDQIGLNDVYLAQKLKEGLESENLSIRIRYLDMAYKLKDVYPTERHKVETPVPKVVKELVFVKARGNCQKKEKQSSG